jgi:hypothetical protein
LVKDIPIVLKIKRNEPQYGSFGEKGEWNNLMWYMIACNWDIDNNYEIKMKYHFRQEEYDA